MWYGVWGMEDCELKQRGWCGGVIDILLLFFLGCRWNALLKCCYSTC